MEFTENDKELVQNPQLIAYIQSVPGALSQKAVLTNQLIVAGWPPEEITAAFAAAYPSSTQPASPSPVSQTVQAQASQASKHKKPKPPIAAQVLTGLALVAIIGAAIEYAGSIMAANSDDPSKLFVLFIGGSLARYYAATTVAFLSIVAYFWLALKVRALHRWALIALTALLISGLIGSLPAFILGSNLVGIFMYGSSGAWISGLIYAIGLVLVWILWKRNGKDFH